MSSIEQGGYYDIFKNPTKQEMQDVIANGYGVRIIMDVPKKNIYVASGDIMHRHMLKSDVLKNDLKFGRVEWEAYWGRGAKADSIFMFSVDNSLMNVDSDSLYNLMFITGSANREAIKENLDKLLALDWNWVRKYGLMPKELTGYIMVLRKKL